MAGAGGNMYELEQWKKALLSRDFDLVHTQLLLLDGDLTPSERAQLVQEIFTTVKQIEDLTHAKFNSAGAPTSAGQAHMVQTITVKTEDAGPRSVQNPQATVKVKTENDRPPSKRESQVSPETSKRPVLSQAAPVQCPVCEVNSKVLTKEDRDKWHCNSCRAFKLRLERMFSRGLKLPTCLHRGKKAAEFCRGCRRFKLEEFWLKNRQHLSPYQMPLMSNDNLDEEETSNTSLRQDSPNNEGTHTDSEVMYDSDFE